MACLPAPPIASSRAKRVVEVPFNAPKRYRVGHASILQSIGSDEGHQNLVTTGDGRGGSFASITFARFGSQAVMHVRSWCFVPKRTTGPLRGGVRLKQLRSLFRQDGELGRDVCLVGS
jgi:hypothetical protein